MRVLVIEDDMRLASVIARVLRQERFEVDVAADGSEGLDRALSGVYDALIIDRMLPELGGLDLLRTLRAERIATPALMLTARTRPPERVEGLDAGADDYLGKPFDVDELLARLRALLRRGERPLLEPTITIGPVTIDLAAHTVCRNGQLIALAPREYAVLELLARHRGRVVTRDQVLARVWGYDADPQHKAVDLHVHYLRRKLDPNDEDAAPDPHRARRRLRHSRVVARHVHADRPPAGPAQRRRRRGRHRRGRRGDLSPAAAKPHE